MRNKMGENKNIPQIRFNGFDESWEVKKLGEIGFTYSGLFGKSKIDFGHGEGKYITYMNIFSNPITNVDITAPIEIDINQNEVEFGDVFFTTSSETPEEVGMTSVWLGSGKNTYLNSFCFGYRLTEELDSYFIAYLLRSFNTRKKITYLAQGISRYNISKNKVMQICISRPKISEQYHIGSYFQNLDKLITLQQQKHDKLVTLKKAMLDKMFPKEGADVPEIRFKEFTEAWKEGNLGDLSESFEYGLNAPATPYDGTNKYLRITDIDDVSHNFNKNDLTTPKTNLNLAGKFKLSSNDILFARTGASVGKSYIYKESDGLVYFAGFLIRAIIKSEINAGFVFQNTLTERYIKFIRITSQRSGQPGVNAIEYSRYRFMIPTKKEQDKIDIFLSKLDKLISLHQQEIQKLKNIKKACLEKMFV